MKLDFETARQLADAVLAHGASVRCNPLAVAITDLTGTPLVLLRSDGAPPMWAPIALAKARTAIAFGQPSAWVDDLAEQRPMFTTSIMGVAQGALVAAAGGIPLKIAGAIVGGAGVAGDTSENDALFAQKAAEECGFDSEAAG